MNRPRVGTALLAAAWLAACNPNTTRPAVTPSPGSLTLIVPLERGEAIALLAQRLQDDSIPVARVDTLDAWLESPWIDSLGHVTTARPIGPNVIRLRGWADPAKVGSSVVTVELSWRPYADPSVPQRELDRDVAATSPIAKRLGDVMAKIKKDYGGD